MNVFNYSNWAESNWKMNLKSMSDYEPSYTFYADLAIAEFCEVYLKDKNAIKKTFNEVVKSWGDNIKAMTEFAMVLNHKSWAFYEYVDGKVLGISKDASMEISQMYCDLYYKIEDIIIKRFEKDHDAMSYYYRMID